MDRFRPACRALPGAESPFLRQTQVRQREGNHPLFGNTTRRLIARLESHQAAPRQFPGDARTLPLMFTFANE